MFCWTKNTPKPDFFEKRKKIIQNAKIQKCLEICQYPLIDTRLNYLYIYCLSVRNSQIIPLDLNIYVYIYIFDMQKKR